MAWKGLSSTRLNQIEERRKRIKRQPKVTYSRRNGITRIRKKVGNYFVFTFVPTSSLRKDGRKTR